MNNPVPNTKQAVTHHPMMIVAAIAIILFCLAGTAAIMGWIPSSMGGASSSGELTASDRAALASRLADDGAAGAGVEAQREQDRLALAERERERDRLAQLERDRELERERARERDAAPVVKKQPVRVAAAPAAKWCNNCGNVESVRAIKQRAEGSGLGAAGGAVLGGLLGSQVGGGNGKKLATVAGAVGGAVVGNQVEGNMKATTSYEIRVRMDDGSARTFTRAADNYNTGDRVKIVNGELRRAG